MCRAHRHKGRPERQLVTFYEGRHCCPAQQWLCTSAPAAAALPRMLLSLHWQRRCLICFVCCVGYSLHYQACWGRYQHCQAWWGVLMPQEFC